MTYENIANTIIESTADDWLYSNGMGRILNKKDIHICLKKADDKELKLPAADDRLMNAYEQKPGTPITYRLYYDDILIEPLRYVPLTENKVYVPCPYFYSLSRFGGVMITSLEQAIGLVLNLNMSKADYLGFLEKYHMYADDAARNAKMKDWMQLS